MQCIGLLADTHGVFCPAAAAVLKRADLVLHAGDVGAHGGHAEVLTAYAHATTAPLLAVAGNVDDVPPGASQLLPDHRVQDVAGWKLLVVHIVAPSATARVDPAAAALIEQHQPDVVVFGHSHKAAHWQAKDGRHFINPGSAGPARFNLKRTVAKLWLPPRPADPSSVLQLSTAAPQASGGTAPPAAGVAAGDGCDQAGAAAILQLFELPAKAPSRLKVRSQG